MGRICVICAGFKTVEKVAKCLQKNSHSQKTFHMNKS